MAADHAEIRDCALLASAVYMESDADIGAFLTLRGHRFSGGITCSNIANDNDHFVFAQVREEKSTTTYLAIRGGLMLENWGRTVQAWPTQKEIGMVHAGWYARMLHLPQHFLIQCIRDGHRVVICGHSLGGASAQFLTLSILESFAENAADRELLARIKCVSFAGPMVISGSAAVNHVNHHFKDNFVNFVHSKDIVPKLVSFSQAALKDLSSRGGREASVTALATMIHSAVDPTAYKHFAAVVVNGTAALLESGVQDVALPYGSIGHNYKVDTSARSLVLVSQREVENEGIWSSAELTTDAVHRHNMSAAYLPAVLSGLDANTVGRIVQTAPASLQLPRPVIHRVDLHRTGRQILVRIFGTNLYMVKSVTSSVLPLCALDHRVSAQALVSAEQLMFTVDPLQTAYGVSNTPGTVARLSVSPGLCYTDAIVFPPVPVRVVDTHPMDLFSLQELVMAAIYLLLFVSRGVGHHDNPKFADLRKLLTEILATVPLSVFFRSAGPLAGHCLEKHMDTAVPILLEQRATRDALREYIAEGQMTLESVSNPVEAQVLRAHIEALQQRLDTYLTQRRQQRNQQPHLKQKEQVQIEPHAQQHNILTVLALCHHPPLVDQEGGLRVLLEVLAGTLNLAREALQAELTPETYSTFLGALGLALHSTNVQILRLGKYYNPAQSELGPLTDALTVFLNSPTVRIAIKVVSAGLIIGGSAAGLIFFGNLVMVMCVAGAVFNPVLVVAYVGLMTTGSLLMVLFGSFPARALKSSGGLRDSMLEALKVNVGEGTTVGEREAALATNLRSMIEFGPLSSFAELRPLVAKCFPSVLAHDEQYPHVLRRLKLTVLSDALRTTLQHLPVAFITGPTRSGKSTFREYMQNGGPNRSNYGPKAQQRTSVPELFFCGEPDRPIGLLDSVGLGDPTNNEVFAAIEQANKIFRMFCQASVVVVNESDTSAAGRNLMYHTSAVQPRTPIQGAAPPHHPTITCFTNADKMLGVGGIFPEDEDGPADLVKEAKDRVVRGEPFDLRSPQEDPFAPRVLACFEGKLGLPAEYNNVVYTTAQVREWLYSHFYPKR
jgi:hypothetical protein